MSTFSRLVTVAAVLTVTTLTARDGLGKVRPPNAHAHGAKKLGKWLKRFFVWDGAIPVVNGSHPGLDLGDVDCSLGQSGKVWFLSTAPSLDVALERRCSVPAGKKLYVPILSWVCPPDLSGRPVEVCLAEADGVFDAVDLSLAVDGASLDDAALDAYRALTGRFDLPLVDDSFWDVFCGCDVGTSLDFAADGIGALVGPLSVGPHEIVIGYQSGAFGFAGSLTYRITVTPKHESTRDDDDDDGGGGDEHDDD
jgi:hypothetical protein